MADDTRLGRHLGGVYSLGATPTAKSASLYLYRGVLEPILIQIARSHSEPLMSYLLQIFFDRILLDCS
jgi:hypothetical protein